MRILKTVLPVSAGALLAICVVLPLSARQDFSFILSKDRVDAAPERMRVDRAVYRGEDARGRAFSISAREAVQRTSATPVVDLGGIRADLRTAEGPATAVANKGRYDLESERIDVVGPLKVTAPGYVLDTRDVAIDLPTRRVIGSGQVTGRMPLGTFEAARMTADVNGRTVVLDGGASLRIVQRRGRGAR